MNQKWTMNLSDWIISISGAAIGLVLAIAAFFAQKWISTVDDSLKEINLEIKNTNKQLLSLESKTSSQSEITAKTVKAELLNIRLPDEKFNDIKKDVAAIKNTINDKVLHKIDIISEDFGRVVVIEDKIKEQDQKILSLFKAVKLIVEKYQK